MTSEEHALLNGGIAVLGCVALVCAPVAWAWWIVAVAILLALLPRAR